MERAVTVASALDTPLLAALAARAGRASAAGGPEPGPGSAGDCELCAGPLPDGHRHVLDVTAGDEPLCACASCAVLFDDRAAGGRRYRLVPRERRELPGFWLDDAWWAGLGVRAGLAFFVRDGAVTARCPGPAGAARVKVPLSSWLRLVDANPVLAGLRPAVEALVVHRPPEAEHWILPIDDCHRLTALLRTPGNRPGGAALRARVRGFFTEMRGETMNPPEFWGVHGRPLPPGVPDRPPP